MTFGELRREQTTTTDDALRGGVDQIVAAGLAVGRLHDEMVGDAVDDLTARGELACRAGCSYCCHMEVAVTMVELVSLAATIERDFTPAQRTALVARLDNYATARAALPAGERVRRNLACPLLVDDKCSAHAARPLACRGWNSADVSACEQAFRDRSQPPPSPVHTRLQRTAVALSRGTQDSCRNGALDASAIELAIGLRYVVGDVEQRTRDWLRGETLPEEMKLLPSAGGARKACI